MTDINRDTVVEQLQKFGLKTYEARCFVALSRVPQATAREISEITDVPRTRVYDAIGTLEASGLVSIQHTNPKVFRAAPLEEAVETLRRTYESRLEDVHESLEQIEPTTLEADPDPDHEVWTLSGREAIAARTERLLDQADEELWLIIDAAVLDSELIERIETAANRELRTNIAVVGEDAGMVSLPEDSIYEISADSLTRFGFPVEPSGSKHPPVETDITRLLLVDQRAVLVGTDTTDGSTDVDEQSVYAAGEANGVVVMTRNLLASCPGQH